MQTGRQVQSSLLFGVGALLLGLRPPHCLLFHTHPLPLPHCSFHHRLLVHLPFDSLLLGLLLGSWQTLLLQPDERRGEVNLPWPESEHCQRKFFANKLSFA